MNKLFKRNLLILSSLTFAILIATSTISAVSATIVNKQIEGKGAVAQWSIPGPGGPHTINAIIDKDNSGKDGKIYISIVHPLKGISEANAPVNFKWSMNHVTVEAILTFSGPGRKGTHNIAVSWETNGQTSNGAFTENTPNGLTASINGAWKLGVAKLSISTSSGHHQNTVYTSSWAIVIHGTADVSFTAQ